MAALPAGPGSAIEGRSAEDFEREQARRAGRKRTRSLVEYRGIPFTVGPPFRFLWRRSGSSIDRPCGQVKWREFAVVHHRFGSAAAWRVS
jgi:hypothetical protein